MFAILHIPSGTCLGFRIISDRGLTTAYFEDRITANRELQRFLSDWTYSGLWNVEQLNLSQIKYVFPEFEIIEI